MNSTVHLIYVRYRSKYYCLAYSEMILLLQYIALFARIGAQVVFTKSRTKLVRSIILRLYLHVCRNMEVGFTTIY